MKATNIILQKKKDFLKDGMISKKDILVTWRLLKI